VGQSGPKGPRRCNKGVIMQRKEMWGFLAILGPMKADIVERR